MLVNQRFFLIGLMAQSFFLFCNVLNAAPTVGNTTVLGKFTGHYAPLHPDNVSPHKIKYYGTDLGWTYKHKGQIHILFGDTWMDEDVYYIEESTGRKFDDGFGTIDLEEWSDPTLFSSKNIPLIKLGQNPGTTEASAINPGHAMEAYKTPVGGFSNGTREFGVFFTSKPEACLKDADCNNGLTCDNGLGYLEPYKPYAEEGLTFACVDGSKDCNPDPLENAKGEIVAGSGLCINQTSTNWAESDIGRINSVGLRHLVGIRSTDDPRKYLHTKEWLTNKFFNPAIRTVEQFIPTKPKEYNYGTASNSDKEQKVFVWGRSNFVGVGATGRDLGLHFAYVDMPEGSDFSWDVHYFSGVGKDGKPQFSNDEKQAVALDLDSTQPGIQPREIYDIVDQMSIVWIEQLQHWVMFYSGGMTKVTRDRWPLCGGVELFVGQEECKYVETGNGAVRMRTAKHPWGPWSPPEDVFIGGDSDTIPVEYQYKEGGVLYHPQCKGDSCVTPSGQRRLADYGWLYSPNIIEEWNTSVKGGVDVIWNASTSNPYRVILLRTRINQ